MKCLYCNREAGLYRVCARHLRILVLLRKIQDPRKPKNQEIPLTQ